MKSRLFFCLLSLLGLVADRMAATAAPIYGLTTGNLLVRFDSANPGAIVQVLLVSGLQSGEVLQGIDFRPATGELLALGNSPRLYVVSTNTGTATAIGAPGAFTLVGAAFGLDVNPTVDRVRVVSDADQNIRLNPSTGALAATDTLLNPGNPNVVAVAYARNYPGAATTTLYGIDSGADTLVFHNPPNSGTLNLIGALGFDTGPLCGFDISATEEAFAVLTPTGGALSQLFRINLATGAATLLGEVGGGAIISDLAIVPIPLVRFGSALYLGAEADGKAMVSVSRVNGSQGSMTVNFSATAGTASAGTDFQAGSGQITFTNGQTAATFEVPLVDDAIAELHETVLLALSAVAPDGLVGGITNATLEIVSRQDLPVYLLTTANQLLRFSSTPSVIQTNLAITGLQVGEVVLGIDFRPATGQLYGLGSASRLYVINAGTGVASQVGSAGAFTLSGTEFGFDFNPTVDRIRVVSDADQNLRLNSSDGTLVATDAMLNPGNPNVMASAYLNNFAGTAATALYGIDSLADALVLQNPPNNGTLILIGSLGVDVTETGGFDYTEADQAAYAVFKRAPAATSEIYRIHLNTGVATLLGAVNSAASIRGIAIPEPAPTLKISQTGNSTVLSWTAASAGYVLERSDSLGAPTWDANLPLPIIVTDQKVVTTPLVTTNRFFRLRR